MQHDFLKTAKGFPPFLNMLVFFQLLLWEGSCAKYKDEVLIEIPCLKLKSAHNKLF